MSEQPESKYVAPRDNLSSADKLFVRYYLASQHNGVYDAYRAYRAVYGGFLPEGHARLEAQRMLDKPEVQAALSQESAILSTRLGISAERILREYAGIAFFDPRVLEDEITGDLKKISDLDPVDSRAVAEYRVKDTKYGVERSYRTHSKLAALEKLAAIMGIGQQQQETGPSIQINISGSPQRPDSSDDDGSILDIKLSE